MITILFVRIRGNSVSVMTRLRAGRPRFNPRQGQGMFLLVTASRPALEPTQYPIKWEPGVVSLEVKRSVSEVDHSPASSAEVKNAWSYTSIPQYVYMVWCLVKQWMRVNSLVLR